MRKVSTSINGELSDALAEYINDQADQRAASVVVRAALREYLHRRGYVGPRKVPGITSATVDDLDVDSTTGRDREIEIRDAIDAFFDAKSPSQSTTAIVTVALREYLKARGVLMPTEPFSPTPSDRGSGYSNTSRDHDKVLAEIVD